MTESEEAVTGRLKVRKRESDSEKRERKGRKMGELMDWRGVAPRTANCSRQANEREDMSECKGLH